MGETEEATCLIALCWAEQTPSGQNDSQEAEALGTKKSGEQGAWAFACVGPEASLQSRPLSCEPEAAPREFRCRRERHICVWKVL